MSINHKKHWMFVVALAGTIALTACSPPPQTAENESADAAANPAPVVTQPEVKPLDVLNGLKIVQFGPTSAKAQSVDRLDVWAQADRALDGYEAALWLDGKRLENSAIAGATVTGTIPASLLATKGTFPLEIRVGEDGTKLVSDKVDFIIE